VARGAHLAAIREHGLRVRSRSRVNGWCARPRRASDGLRPPSWSSSAVKSFDTESAAEAIRPVVGPHTGRALHPERRGQRGQAGSDPGPGHVMGGSPRSSRPSEAPGVIRTRCSARHLPARWTGGNRSRAGLSRRLRPRRDPARSPRMLPRSGRSTLPGRPCRHDRAHTLSRRRDPAVPGDAPDVPFCSRRWPRSARRGAGLDEGIAVRLMQTLDALGPNAYTSLFHDLAQAGDSAGIHATRWVGERYASDSHAVRDLRGLRRHLDGRRPPPLSRGRLIYTDWCHRLAGSWLSGPLPAPATRGDRLPRARGRVS